MKDRSLQHPHVTHHFATVGWALLCVLLAATSGCKVRVNKTDGGDNVRIATPFGEIAVNKDDASPAELGLPAYPGAVFDTANDGNKTAKVDMGFGSWKLRVKVAHYVTRDDRDQVLTFYRKALSEYGSVIECAGGKQVGSSSATPEGLSCDHSSSDHAVPHGDFNAGDVELKAGSVRHQHLVVLHPGKQSGNPSSDTHFSLIALDLPHGLDTEEKGTN